MPTIKTIKRVSGGLSIDGQRVVLTETYEGWFWDTVAVENAGAAISAGQEFEFFRDLTNKNLVDSNFKQERRISKGKEFELRTIGLLVAGRQPDGGEVTALNMKFILNRMFFTAKINGHTVAEAPVEAYPAGMGPAGYSSETSTAVLSNGVPSLAAVRPLLVPIGVTSEHDIEGQLRHYAAAWLTTYTAPSIAAADAILVRCYLGGKVKAGITRG